MTLDTVSAEKVFFRDERKPWIVDRSDGIVINYRVSSPTNRTEVEPYFESSYPFFLLRPKPKSGGGASLKPNRPRVPLNTVRKNGRNACDPPPSEPQPNDPDLHPAPHHITSSRRSVRASPGRRRMASWARCRSWRTR